MSLSLQCPSLASPPSKWAKQAPLHLLLLPIPQRPPSSLLFQCTQSQLSLTTMSFPFLIFSISFRPVGSSTRTISLPTSSPLRRAMRVVFPGWTFSPPFTHTSSSVPEHCCLPSAPWLRGKKLCLCLFWRF